MKAIKEQKVSPLKDKPLRYTAQSLDEKIDSLINDKAIYYAIFAMMSVVMACLEWWRYYYHIPPSPIGLTILAVIAVIFCGYKLIKIRKTVRRLKLGRDGERVVGQFLELLRENDCKVYHDIIADNFNIDHLVISKSGVFLIETKTLNKIPQKNSKLYFDGNKIYIDNIELQKNPVTQVLASKNWLKNTIKEMTGKEFKIKPVILFPGWFVESSQEAKKMDIWVLNPHAFRKFIENAPEIITQEEVMLISYNISRYIRLKDSNAIWNDE